MSDFPESLQVHGTAVGMGGRGVLLRGPSGSGKSDLALRLIDGGARLIADDRVDLARIGDVISMSAPGTIAGMMEVRGLGLLAVGAVPRAPLALVVDLVAAEDVERLPRRRRCDLLGLSVPVFDLCAFEAATPAKVRLAVRAVAGDSGSGAIKFVD